MFFFFLEMVISILKAAQLVFMEGFKTKMMEIKLMFK